MRRAIILALGFLVCAELVGGFAYFQYVVKPEIIRQAIAGQAPPPATVTAEAAAGEEWIARLPAIGTLRAEAGIDVTPQVEGVVRRINFSSGEEVAEGTVLVEIEDSVEQAELNAALALLKKSELDLDRQRELLARGDTPKANFDATLAAHDNAAATVERIRALIGKKQIVAPFAGRLGIRNVDPGQYVTAGTRLVALQRLDPIYVDFPVPERDFARLKVNQQVEAKVDAAPDEAFEGRIDSIDARVDQATRTVQVRATLPNAEKRLLPGMFVNVDVQVGAPEPVVTVPATAVTYSLYGESIYVAAAAEAATGAPAPAPAPAPASPEPQASAGEAAAPAGEAAGDVRQAERRAVTVGAARGDRVAILKGLVAGEMVVTSGQIKLQPGARIRIDNSRLIEAAPERPKL